jgi:hypothetical protein
MFNNSFFACIFILKLFFIKNMAIEQKLIIDLKKQSPSLSSSQRSKSGFIGGERTDNINNQGNFINQEQGYLNVLTIEHGAASTMKKRHSYVGEENSNKQKLSTNSIEKVEFFSNFNFSKKIF